MTRKLVACVIMVLNAASLPGCEAPQITSESSPGVASADLSQLFASRHAARVSHDPDAVPMHLNSPRAAAQEVATRAGPIDRSAAQQVRLHASLYRAAIRADDVGHPAYLLNPVAGSQSASAAGLIGRAFRLRVLAELTGIATPVLWDAPTLTWMFDERAHGGPAALAWFEILNTNEELASVEADVCIESPRIGTRKFRVEAIFDGQSWSVHDLGTRTVW